MAQQERAPDNKEQVVAWRCVWERRPASEGEGDRVTIGHPVTTLPLRGREHFSFENAHWLKGATKIRGSTNRVLLANYTLDEDIGMLVLDLINRRTALGFG